MDEEMQRQLGLLHNELGNPTLAPQKIEFLQVTGFVSSPRAPTEYDISSYSRFFQHLGSACLQRYDLVEFRDNLRYAIEILCEHGINDYKDLKLADVREALDHLSDQNVVTRMTTLAVQMFGGHIEHIFSLCFFSNDEYSKVIEDIIKRRFAKREDDLPGTTAPNLRIAHSIFRRLEVVEVILRGEIIESGKEYLLLECIYPDQVFRDRMHSTLLIPKEIDHPVITPGEGVHHLRIVGGMQSIMKTGRNQEDSIPIFLKNAHILERKVMS